MQHPLWPNTAARRSPEPQVVLTYLMLTLVALLPRILGLGQFVTSDEANFWLDRSAAFLYAIQSGDYAAIPSTSHPGVTTMWLGSIGILLERGLEQAGLLRVSSYATRLALLQVPVALTHVVGILMAYRLLRRLLPGRVATLAALLWAADPFVIAFDRLLHVDGLAGTFSTLCVLCACVYWHHDRRWRWLIGAAVSAGLALLSKSPSLVLLPVVGLIALSAARRTLGAGGYLRGAALPILAGSLICGIVVVALWPALWVKPIESFDALRFGVVNEGAQPHMLGNFFLGGQDDAPGVLFYPVATVLRLTPWALLGLLLLPWAWRQARASERHDLAALACFALLLILALSPFPKKFNRYLVPIFPALDILAAYGLAWGVEQLASLGRRGVPLASWRRAVVPALSGAVMAGALVNVVWWHPYEIAAFNQVLGGAAAGEQTFTVGWGEGLEQVADWLNQQADITGVLVASTQVPTLQPYLRRGAQAVTPVGALPEQTGYVVIYVRDAQSGPPGAPFGDFARHRRPVYTVRIHGVAYAWIYQVPPSVAYGKRASFGSAIHLRGYTPIAEQSRRSLRMKLFWKVLAPPTSDYTLFAHLLGADGRRYAQADLPYPTSQWDADRYLTTELLIPLPAALAAGTYEVVIGWYDPTTGRRLPLEAPRQLRSARDGPNSLMLMQAPLGQTRDK